MVRAVKILKSPQYSKWLSTLQDRKALMRIDARILQIQHHGRLTGDFKSVGEGVTELRFHFGPGYRVYVSVEGATLLLLLIGGDKSSQARDIAKAKKIARAWRDGMMNKWIEWDAAQDLTSEEDVADFLNAVLELNDPSMLSDALGVVARARGMGAIAEKTGLGRESLYKSLSKTGNPRFSTIASVLDSFGLRLQVVPVKQPASV